MNMREIGFILFFLVPTILASQDKVTLTYEDFIATVTDYHPVLSQIALLDEQSDAYLLKAKGNFDPTVDFQFGKKSFDDKNYYRKIDGNIKIPTRIGLDIVAGYENNVGQFLDSEESLPGPGLLSAGISLPLGNGLRYDERRKVLDEAKLIGEKNELKQIEVYNKVLFNATKSYIEWQNDYQKVLLYEQANVVATQSFMNSKQLYIQGVGTAMDTLEAQLNLDQRNASLLKSEQNYFVTKQALNNYLWGPNNVLLALNESTFPQILTTEMWIDQVASLQVVQDERIQNITAVRNLGIESAQLGLDKKLEREFLKPIIDLKYNPLFRLDDNNRFLSYTTSDYKAGVQAYYPIFARKARGNLKLIDIDIESLGLELPLLIENTNIDLQTLIQNNQTILDRLMIARKNILGATRLFEAEMIKFNLGESSQFLLNSREFKKLDFELKALELEKELLKNRTKYIYKLQAF